MKTNTIQLNAFTSPYKHLKTYFKGLGSLFFFLWLGTLQTNAQDWNAIIKRSAGNHQNTNTSARSTQDKFGSSVAISGDIAIVGAPYEDEDAYGKNTIENAGAAFIFQRVAGKWTQIKKITAPDRAIQDVFGNEVAISGDYAIVSATGEDEDTYEQNTINSAGSAYIYYRNQGGAENWGLLKKIIAPNRTERDFFGFKVAISNDYAVIGATDGAGSAYIFYQNEGGIDNWGLKKKITAPNGESNDMFGIVDISGDYIIVGASYEDEDIILNRIIKVT